MIFIKKAAETSAKIVSIEEDVAKIIKNVRIKGDQALLELTSRYDGVALSNLRVSPEEVKKAYSRIDEKTIEYLRLAAARIRSYGSCRKWTIQSFFD